MRVRDYAMGMAAYNRWMNDRLYAVCAEVPDPERRRDRGAFFKSIHATLNHILLGDRWWMQRFAGQPLTPSGPVNQELYADFDELRAARREADAALEAWAAALSDDFAEEPFRFVSKTYKAERELPTWAVIVHVFNHQTHHRGQITTLLSQLGIDAGPTDFPWMPFFDGWRPS